MTSSQSLLSELQVQQRRLDVILNFLSCCYLFFSNFLVKDLFFSNFGLLQTITFVKYNKMTYQKKK